MPVTTTECPCEGKHKYHWHKSRGIPQCTYSSASKSAGNRRWRHGEPAWTPGTPIHIPEIDPL